MTTTPHIVVCVPVSEQLFGNRVPQINGRGLRASLVTGGLACIVATLAIAWKAPSVLRAKIT